jgi:hypothetical protein
MIFFESFNFNGNGQFNAKLKSHSDKNCVLGAWVSFVD